MRSVSEAPLKDLIRDGQDRLGVSRNELLRRMGYANLEKGRRRLREVEAGDLRVARLLSDRLAAGLDLPVSAVLDAIGAERDVQARAEEEAYRAGFRPHAVLLTERTRPSSVTMAGLSGAHRLLVVEVPDGTGPQDRAGYVLSVLPEGVPFFGRVTGFVVNHAPDHAVRHELDGTAVAELDRAVRVGVSVVRVG